MNSVYAATERQTGVSTWRVFKHCLGVFHEWRERAKVRANLCRLADRELRDMGISESDIEYVASNRSGDPRGVRSGG